jgi:hypothetical protein
MKAPTTTGDTRGSPMMIGLVTRKGCLLPLMLLGVRRKLVGARRKRDRRLRRWT